MFLDRMQYRGGFSLWGALFCLICPPEHQPHEDIFMDKKSNFPNPCVVPLS